MKVTPPGPLVCGGISWTWVDVVQHNFLVERCAVMPPKRVPMLLLLLELGGPKLGRDFAAAVLSWVGPS